jgi:hypothetical protein
MKGTINIGIEMCYMLVLGVPVMLIWNEVIPEVFKLSQITYLQALQMMILLYCFKLGLEPATGKNAKFNIDKKSN